MNAAITLWSKHIRKTLSNPEEMIGMLIQPVLWVVLFGVGMKSMMGPGMAGGNDASYIAFMAPGIVALSALGGAVAGGSTWLNERLRGIVKEYLAAPIPRLSILAGNAISTVTKALFQGVVIFIVGMLMGTRITGNPLGWLGGLILVSGFAMGFAGISIGFASMTDNVGAYHSMIMLLNLPLLFLSNALYPLSTMPTWMRIGSYINPTTYVIDGMRQMMMANDVISVMSDPIPLWICFAVVIFFAFLGMRMGLSAFKKSIR
jgi:ABC-2 type transport system permease protein